MAWSSLSEIFSNCSLPGMQLLSTSGSLSLAQTTSRLAASWTCPFIVIAIGLLRHFWRPDIKRWPATGKALSARRSIALAWMASGLAPRLWAAKGVTLRKIVEGGTMPVINADGCPIYVEVEGPERAPVLMLSNSLGTTLHMWDRQVAPFTQHFRLVRYDRRGHGRSGVPKGPYTMERLGRDVLAVLDALGLKRINWCGLSMGGMVGQWLGANAPERIERLVLTNTSSYFADQRAWNDRLKLVREKGIPAFAATNGALVHQRVPRGLARRRRVVAGDVRRDAARRLHRVRRGGARHAPPRAVAEDQSAHPRHRRQARSGDAARGERVHQEPHPGRTARAARRRAYFQRRAGGSLHQCGAGIFARKGS